MISLSYTNPVHGGLIYLLCSQEFDLPNQTFLWWLSESFHPGCDSSESCEAGKLDKRKDTIAMCEQISCKSSGIGQSWMPSLVHNFDGSKSRAAKSTGFCDPSTWFKWLRGIRSMIQLTLLPDIGLTSTRVTNDPIQDDRADAKCLQKEIQIGNDVVAEQEVEFYTVPNEGYWAGAIFVLEWGMDLAVLVHHTETTPEFACSEKPWSCLNA